MRVDNLLTASTMTMQHSKATTGRCSLNIEMVLKENPEGKAHEKKV